MIAAWLVGSIRHSQPRTQSQTFSEGSQEGMPLSTEVTETCPLGESSDLLARQGKLILGLKHLGLSLTRYWETMG